MRRFVSRIIHHRNIAAERKVRVSYLTSRSAYYSAHGMPRIAEAYREAAERVR